VDEGAAEGLPDGDGVAEPAGDEPCALDATEDGAFEDGATELPLELLGEPEGVREADGDGAFGGAAEDAGEEAGAEADCEGAAELPGPGAGEPPPPGHVE